MGEHGINPCFFFASCYCCGYRLFVSVDFYS